MRTLKESIKLAEVIQSEIDKSSGKPYPDMKNMEVMIELDAKTMEPVGHHLINSELDKLGN